MTKPRKMFVNLAVKDLDRAKIFFASLGFSCNPQFTDQNSACLVLSDENYAMLLTEPFFKGFTSNGICDTRTANEALIALSCDGRDEVKRLGAAAVAAGGRRAQDPKDLGFMYVEAVYDLDGHHWEFFWMDPANIK